MPGNPVIDALAAEVAQEVDIMKSAKILIDGFAARTQAAIDAALANGATAEQLVPVTQIVTDLNDNGDALAASVAANTAPPA